VRRRRTSSPERRWASAHRSETTGHLGQFARAVLGAPGAALSVSVLVILVATAVVAPHFLGQRAAALDVPAVNQGPSKLHWLGTDGLGRDIFARTLVATRLSLSLAALATAIAASIGVVFGAGIALAGARVRVFGARLIDTLLGFPSILMGIFVATIVGPSAKAAVIGIGVAFAPQFARIVNNLAESVAGKDYVASARVLGLSVGKLLRRHVLPNIGETIVLVTFVSLGDSIIAVSALSFLGLGVQPPGYDWGQMLTQGVQAFYLTPALALAPAFAIAFAGLTASLLGDAIARAFNPLLWTHARKGERAVASRALSNAHAATGTPTPGDSGDDSAAPPTQPALLTVEHLAVSFVTRTGSVAPVVDASFHIAESEIVGLVGESGSGKTLTALAVAGLIPWPGRISAESLVLRGQSLLSQDRRDVEQLLGRELALVFQDPMSSFNPVLRIGSQITEGIQTHRDLPRRAVKELAVGRLREVGIAAPERRLSQFPYEFSGGMRQRAMIAMALMMSPSLIIADEPTTSLDVTIQAQIVDLLRRVNQSHGTAILLISHDLALVSEVCQRVLVMYGGRIVEDIPAQALREAAHPYTRALVASLPSTTARKRQHLVSIPGAPPDPALMPPGCPFTPRCPLAIDKCTEMPPLETHSARHRVACWRAADALSLPLR
jgi:peptide/nickel transport system permease protein